MKQPTKIDDPSVRRYMWAFRSAIIAILVLGIAFGSTQNYYWLIPQAFIVVFAVIIGFKLRKLPKQQATLSELGEDLKASKHMKAGSL